MILKKDDMLAVIDYETMSIQTHLKHPVKGRSILLRKRLSMMLIGKVLEDPRTHTSRGLVLADNL